MARGAKEEVFKGKVFVSSRKMAGGLSLLVRTSEFKGYLVEAWKFEGEQ